MKATIDLFYNELSKLVQAREFVIKFKYNNCLPTIFELYNELARLN